ncbi:MAG: translocation/assembly module TamB [Treponema sp.]|nr:translocation/assembly module TamB [Treponema sp.]
MAGTGGKKYLIQISFMFSVFWVLVGLTVLVLRPIQISVKRNMEELKDAFIGRIGNLIGRRLEYGSLGPSIFGTLDLRDVKILRDDNSAVLWVSRLRLSYSLPALITGRTGGAFSSARVDRPVLTLDFEQDEDLLRLLSSLGTGEPGGPGFLPENFHIRLRNGLWELAGEAGNFSLSLGLDLSIHKGQISLQGRWSAGGVLNPGGSPGLGDMFRFSPANPAGTALSAFMTGRINGEYSISAAEGRASIVVPSLSGDTFRTRSLSMSLLLRDSRLELRKIYDRSPADISLLWDLREQKLRAAFTGENFSPKDLVTFTGPWTAYNQWLSLRLSGAASLEKEGAGMPEYALDLKGLLPQETPLGNVSFTIACQGDGKGVRISDCSVNSSRGAIRYQGEIGFPLAPNGFIQIIDLGLYGDEGNDERISAELYITTQGQEISLFGENLKAGPVTFSALDASVIREDMGLTFILSVLRFRDMEEYGDVRLSSFSLEGSLDYDPRHIQASLRLDSFSIGDMLKLIRPLGAGPAFSDLIYDTADDLLVTTEIFFTTDYEHVLYNAPRFVAAYEGPRDILAVASISGTDKRFELDGGQISWTGGTAGVSGMLDFSNPMDISFSLDASHKNMVYYLEGSVLDRDSLSVRGSYGLQVYLGSAGFGSYSGYAKGDNIPIPSGDGYAQLVFLISLRYDSPSSWSAEIDRFELTGIAAPDSSAGSLRFSGWAGQDGARVQDIVYEDGNGVLAGNLDAAWDHDFRNITLNLAISDREGREAYSLNGSYRDRQLDAALSGREMNLARLSRNTRNADATGDFRLSWKPGESFTAGAELHSLVFYLQDTDMRIRASASLDPDVFFLSDVQVSYGGLEASMPYFKADRRLSLAETRAEIHGALAGRGVDISFRSRAEFKPLRSWLDLKEALDSVSGSLDLDTARYDTLEAGEPFSFTFSSLRDEQGNHIALSGGPRNMIRFRYSPDNTGRGNFYAALSPPLPIRGSFIGSLSSKTIDAQVSDLYVDLGSLWRFIPPQDTIAFPGGIVSGSVQISGSLRDPEFNGSLRATSVRIQVPEYITEDIRPVPVAVSLDGNEMSFGPVDAVVGNGSGLVSAWFRFERWIPNIFNMDIVVPLEDPIPFGFDISGVLARGQVSGKLNLSMADMILTVSGDLTAQNTEISLNAEEISAPDGSPPTGIMTVTDIRIKTGRRVEFFWPNAAFPMLQAYTDLGTGIRITNDETSRRFSLQGDVRLRSGEIFYLERNFYIREGTLFFNENELDFDPRISARAEIRDQSEEGPVTISMIIENAPLKSFTPRFESSPALSQLEIFSLLGQNPQGLSGDAGDRRNPMLSFAGDALTQFIVLRRLQKTVRDFLGMDMFSIRTQVLQNMVYSAAGISPGGGNDLNSSGEPAERAYRAGNYFDNTTVFFGKYIGSDIFVQSLFSFRYDETKQTWGGLKLEPEIGLEMRNPLFNIQLNMALLHPENWFINDVSFTLTWKRSF